MPGAGLLGARRGEGPPQGNGAGIEGELVELEITPSNCVQCGAITAKGGRLTPPEGGDGPNYQQT